MPIPRLDRDRTALLVIDLQERLMPTILAADTIVRHAGILLRIAERLQLPVVLTEQYTRGLGPTVTPLRDALPEGTARFEKTRFGAGIPEVLAELRRRGRSAVLLCGIEAHVCVLQTALDLLAAGFVPYLVTDAIGASQASQIPMALRRMESAGAIPTGILSATYELLADASDPAFRACLELAKQVDRGQ